MKKEILITIFDRLQSTKTVSIKDHQEIQPYIEKGYEIKSFQQSVVSRSEKETYKIAITILLILKVSRNKIGSPDKQSK